MVTRLRKNIFYFIFVNSESVIILVENRISLPEFIFIFDSIGKELILRRLCRMRMFLIKCSGVEVIM